ncbi:hypothetical protein BDY21DRAFT_360340 [Lineolata rhizophorae]|uniref:Uncharacterized protein n=1 Tax=Lineolata rhizophorae TaxID=578093 RepID=A0A6A6PGB5_9PEZI|nr:hypothetical protein BDY21DRAFT_360340 [Lineolata rhizophorae]
MPSCLFHKARASIHAFGKGAETEHASQPVDDKDKTVIIANTDSHYARNLGQAFVRKEWTVLGILMCTGEREDNALADTHDVSEAGERAGPSTITWGDLPWAAKTMKEYKLCFKEGCKAHDAGDEDSFDALVAKVKEIGGVDLCICCPSTIGVEGFGRLRLPSARSKWESLRPDDMQDMFNRYAIGPQSTTHVFLTQLRHERMSPRILFLQPSFGPVIGLSSLPHPEPSSTTRGAHNAPTDPDTWDGDRFADRIVDRAILSANLSFRGNPYDEELHCGLKLAPKFEVATEPVPKS